MPLKSLESRMLELESARYRFGQGDGTKIERLLRSLNRTRFADPSLLMRFHETLLFVRAFPQNAAVLETSKRILSRFQEEVEALVKTGADMQDFDTFEYAGVAGTTMEDTLSFDVARWLVKRLPGQVEIAWDNYEPGRELGMTGLRFMPLLEDDAFVEADTPWRCWLETASAVARKRKGTTATWLIERFEALPMPEELKAELYESLRVPLRWHLGNSQISRTRNWKQVRKVFYHDGPLISRSEVSLAEELAKRPPTFTRLWLREGEVVAEMIREVMLVRYRELYGTTLADPRSVVRVDLGDATSAAKAEDQGQRIAAALKRSATQNRRVLPSRRSGQANLRESDNSRGVEIYLWSLPPKRRLPLRAYVAGVTLKNGVPINYIEAIGLCEWMEVGFNTFYTFRGGEAGWIYAQVLRCLCSWMGTTVISVYPYQLGHDNDEAIESGAFWFYRKLGFRPGRADLLKLAEREEEKIAADPKYRTPPRTLRRLAAGHVCYELPGSEVGAWDRFSTRNIGLRVNERMAREFGGDAGRMRADSRRKLESVLGVSTKGWPAVDKTAFDNFALCLAGERELRTWAEQGKRDLVTIIRAKGKADEMLYLHLTQRHARLRKMLLRLGS